jgi:hypothetical protein
MGEMIGDFKDSHEYRASADKTDIRDSSDGFETDVEGIKANAVYGNGNLPVFDVDPEEFYQNSEFGRKRMRFKSGSNVQQYMQKTKYSNPFYIRTTNKDGKQYIKKVK